MTTINDSEEFLIESHLAESLSEDIDNWACVVLPHLDYEAQLVAIKHILDIHENDENTVAKDIKKLGDFIKKTKGAREDYIEHLIGEQISKFNFSVYQSAAHSMAAVGMLAPFVESIFHQAFHGIWKEIFSNNKRPNDHFRWEEASLETWDCHFVWTNGHWRKNLVEGILQLSDATGLKSHLPNDIETLLSVLFSYRNKMFHCGFEWPIEERNRFWIRIEKENWPSDWLSAATSDGEPWIIYLTDNFLEHCINSIEQIINGISRFVYSAMLNKIKSST
jgi:hypothetical protein